ncbi:MAG: hypothetical protein MHMPM18_001175 [Marteilia pararefringens]
MTETIDNIPRHSLYLSNLNEKIKKTELKQLLYSIFSPYGLIADIYSSRHPSKKGQAFIIFCNISEAAKAKRALNGANFLGKDLKIEFTKSDSKIVAKYRNKYENKNMSAKNFISNQILNEKAADLIKKPNSILFISNLPNDTKESTLHEIFSNNDGFVELRFKEENPGIAFVEFLNDTFAAQVMENMQGFKITEQNELQIEFSK